MAERFSCRPSELLGLARSDPYLAWCIDESVHTFVSYVENKIHEGTKHCKKPEDMRNMSETIFRIIFAEHGENMVPIKIGPDEAARLSENPPVPSVGTFKDPAVVLAELREQRNV